MVNIQSAIPFMVNDAGDQCTECAETSESVTRRPGIHDFSGKAEFFPIIYIRCDLAMN
jgi:hypothetical protein